MPGGEVGVLISAVLVTRGDVDMSPVLDSMPRDWEVVVWDNGHLLATVYPRGLDQPLAVQHIPLKEDFSVFGRYAGVEFAQGQVIYVQDDDVVVSNPRELVSSWFTGEDADVACNMPMEFRHEFYQNHALVGFGGVFWRGAPRRVFGNWAVRTAALGHRLDRAVFHRTCDVVFTGMSTRMLLDVPKTNLPWAESEDRMYRQRQHAAERLRTLELVREVLDAG